MFIGHRPFDKADPEKDLLYYYLKDKRADLFWKYHSNTLKQNGHFLKIDGCF